MNGFISEAVQVILILKAEKMGIELLFQEYGTSTFITAIKTKD